MSIVSTVIVGARHGRVTKYFRRQKYTTSNHDHGVSFKIELVAFFASSWCTLIHFPINSHGNRNGIRAVTIFNGGAGPPGRGCLRFAVYLLHSASATAKVQARFRRQKVGRQKEKVQRKGKRLLAA